MHGLSKRLLASLGGVALVVCALGVSGCIAQGDDDGPDVLARGRRYVDDASYRERALEESLVVDDNDYAALRLTSYAGTWAALSVFDPAVRPVTLDDVGQFVDRPSRPSSPDEPSLAPVLGDALASGDDAWTEASLLALGERAFEEYPVQLAPEVGRATASRAEIDRFGLWVDDRGRVGGLVRVATPDGGEHFALTCATCHARAGGSGFPLVHGASNEGFDWGGILARDALELGLGGEAEEDAARLLGWGPGHVDVTSDDMDNPVTIPDLRAVRRHAYLQYAGTLDNDLIALAVRIETLMITSSHAAVRPPREIAFALALYLWRMGDAGSAGDVEAEPEGAALFDVRCGACHGSDGTTPTARVSIDRVGTDAAAGLSPERGTGFYRVPSLWGVAQRSQLLHAGRVSSLEALLDPARLDTVAGHAFGLDLDDEERAALARFVRTIGAR